MKKMIKPLAVAFGLCVSPSILNAQYRDFTPETIRTLELSEATIIIAFNSPVGMAIRSQLNDRATEAYKRTSGRMSLLTPTEIDNIHFNNLLNNYSNESYRRWPVQQRLTSALCALDASSYIFGSYGFNQLKNDLDSVRRSIYRLFKRPTAKQCSRAYELGAN